MSPLIIPAFRRTGHALLDVHHAEVLGWANIALRCDSEGDRGRLEQILAGLIETFEAQHAHEELAMERCRHPGLPRHLAEHRRVVSSLRALHQRALAASELGLIVAELHSFVQAWLRYHAQGFDRDLAEDLAAAYPGAEHPHRWVH